jgi:hypothetical protein
MAAFSFGNRPATPRVSIEAARLSFRKPARLSVPALVLSRQNAWV